MERKVIPVLRDVEARIVPTGIPISIPEGTFVTLTQALGGTYTVVYNGNMARIEGEEADAIGFEPIVIPLDPPKDGRVSNDQIWKVLRSIHDPEIPVNVVDLGLIYGIEENDGAVKVRMTLTAPGCGMGPVLVRDIEERLQRVPFVRSVKVQLVFDPPWSRERMSDEAQLELGLF